MGEKVWVEDGNMNYGWKRTASGWGLEKRGGWAEEADLGTYGLDEEGDFGIPSPVGGPTEPGKDGPGEPEGKASKDKPGEPEREDPPVLRIMCPNFDCGRVLAVPSSARGKLVRCRGCGVNIRIPAKRK